MRDLAADQDNVRRAIETAFAAGDGHHRASYLYRDDAVLDFAWRLDGGMRAASGLRWTCPAPATGDCEAGHSLRLGNLLLLSGDLAEAEARFSEGTPPCDRGRRRRDPGTRVDWWGLRGVPPFPPGPGAGHVGGSAGAGGARRRRTGCGRGPAQPRHRRRKQRPPGPGGRTPRPGHRSGSTNGRRSAAPVAARLGRRDAALARGLSGGGGLLWRRPRPGLVHRRSVGPSPAAGRAGMGGPAARRRGFR